MKPDFFDDYNLDEIYNPDKSENEIDDDFSIECKSCDLPSIARFILSLEIAVRPRITIA